MTRAEALWCEPDRAEAVRRDAIALARFAVTSPDLRNITRREVLSKYVLILLTHGTSNGKYETRYRSAVGGRRSAVGGRDDPDPLRPHAAGSEVTDVATGDVVPQSVGQRPPLPHERPER